MSAVDVSIVAYNSRDRISALVPLLREDPMVGRVVVVDHGGDDSATAARIAGAEVIEDPRNPGFGAGHNRAIARTAAPFVLLVNPDIAPEADILRGAVEFLNAHPNAAVVQGAIRSERDGKPERSAGRALGPVHLWGRLLRVRAFLAVGLVRALARHSALLSDHVERESAVPREVESLAATMILVRRTAFDGVGGFDPSYFLYGEDLDLCRRLRQSGWALWALPEVWAAHASGESSDGRWERELVWWEGTMRYAGCWWNTDGWLAALVAATLRAATLAASRPLRTVEVFRRVVIEPIRARQLK